MSLTANNYLINQSHKTRAIMMKIAQLKYFELFKKNTYNKKTEALEELLLPYL